MAPRTINTRRVEQSRRDNGRTRSRLLSGLNMSNFASQGMTAYPGTYKTARGSAARPKSMSTARKVR